MRVSTLLEPVKIGAVELKNRMVMAPVCINAANSDGTVSEKTLKFYQERAIGFGLVIVEATNIRSGGEIVSHQLQICDDRFIDGFQKLYQAISSGGSKAIIQLNHGGAKCIPKYTGQTFISASNIPITHGQIPRSMTAAEIKEVIQDFGHGAVRAIGAGFDGVEIQGGHFYLLSQFLSPYSNKREDEYGRDLHGRTRFLQEVVQEVRERIGPGHILSCRLNGVEQIENGLTVGDVREISKILESSGLDVLNISGVKGSIDVLYEGRVFKRLISFLTKEDPQGYFVPIAGEIKKAVTIPVMVAGKIFDPYFAEQVLHEGKADLIAFGRQLIVNPDLARVIHDGRMEDIKDCIECFKCLEAILKGEFIECSVNKDLWR